MAGARAYAPYIVFPAALVIGSIGYVLESRLSDRNRGKIQAPSTLEARGDRLLENLEVSHEIITRGIPKSVLDRNLKPGTYNWMEDKLEIWNCSIVETCDPNFLPSSLLIDSVWIIVRFSCSLFTRAVVSCVEKILLAWDSEYFLNLSAEYFLNL